MVNQVTYEQHGQSLPMPHGWGNQWISDYERFVLEFRDYVTFNWLVGTADIFIILFPLSYACCGDKPDNPKVVYRLSAATLASVRCSTALCSALA